MRVPEPKVYVHVVRVKFDPDSKIPRDIQNEISKNETQRTHEADADSNYLTDVAKEIAEVGVRGPLQTSGYFRPLPDAKLAVLKMKGQDIDVEANVSAETGKQYLLGEIQFAAADPDSLLDQSPRVLRDLIPLKRGDLLNVEAIRQGLRNLTRFYNRRGYIDMTAEPQFDVEDSRHWHVMNIVFRIDQQKQYRMGAIEIWGLDTVTKERLLKSLPQLGELFDGYRVEQAFKVNRGGLSIGCLTRRRHCVSPRYKGGNCLDVV